MKNALALVFLVTIAPSCVAPRSTPVERITIGMKWMEAKRANGGSLRLAYNWYGDGTGYRMARVGHVYYHFTKDFDRHGHYHYELTRISF